MTIQNFSQENTTAADSACVTNYKYRNDMKLFKRLSISMKPILPTKKSPNENPAAGSNLAKNQRVE